MFVCVRDCRRSVGRGHPLRQLTRLHASSLARKLQRRARVSCYARRCLRGRPHPPSHRGLVTAAARSAARRCSRDVPIAARARSPSPRPTLAADGERARAELEIERAEPRRFRHLRRMLFRSRRGGEGCPRRGTRSKSPLFGRALRAPTAGVRGHCPAEDTPRRSRAMD